METIRARNFFLFFPLFKPRRLLKLSQLSRNFYDTYFAIFQKWLHALSHLFVKLRRGRKNFVKILGIVCIYLSWLERRRKENNETSSSDFFDVSKSQTAHVRKQTMKSNPNRERNSPYFSNDLSTITIAPIS